ncbi:MAG: hypothetical protein OCD00_06945 [Colwellia sp.]
MINRWCLLASSVLVGFILVACKHTPEVNYQAALLVEPSEQSLQAVKTAVKQLANLPSVVLAKSVFQKDSWLLIDRQQHKNAKGQLIMGNNTEPPLALQLVTYNNQCFLRYPKADKILLLDNVACSSVVN